MKQRISNFKYYKNKYAFFLLFCIGLVFQVNIYKASANDYGSFCKEYLNNGNKINSVTTGLCVGQIKGVSDNSKNTCMMIRLGYKNGKLSKEDFEKLAFLLADVSLTKIVESFVDIWESKPELRDGGITGTSTFWLNKKWPCLISSE